MCKKVEEKKKLEIKQTTTVKPSGVLILCNIQMPATFLTTPTDLERQIIGCRLQWRGY
jgi:hypothetical protein